MPEGLPQFIEVGGGVGDAAAHRRIATLVQAVVPAGGTPGVIWLPAI
jgi:hypothetical protein